MPFRGRSFDASALERWTALSDVRNPWRQDRHERSVVAAMTAVAIVAAVASAAGIAFAGVARIATAAHIVIVPERILTCVVCIRARVERSARTKSA